MNLLNINISIVIVNYKSWQHLTNCLVSLEKIDAKDFNFEVIIIDNCSEDGLLSEFKIRYPNFKFIENSGNNGFANGCNLGVKNSSGDYLLFLNPDTIVSNIPILKMFQFLKKNSKYKMVSCKQKNKNGSYEKINRLFPDLSTLFGFFRAVKNIFSISNKTSYEKVIKTDWVSGAVILISKNWFDKVNGWNEDYWMYYEDVDLSKKVKDLGGEIGLLSDTEIFHNHGGASRKNSKTAIITKTEVIISKHVYFNTHFSGFKHFVIQFLLVLNIFISKFILSIIGIFFFFIPKLKRNIYLFREINKYYIAAWTNKTWLSKRSVNYPKLK